MFAFRAAVTALALAALVPAATASAAAATVTSASTWGSVIEVPGTAALNQDGDSEVTSVSCASAGNCSAGGDYADASLHLQAFVVSETGGRWGTATEVPGTAALDTGGYAWVTSVSCTTAGNCSAGGAYVDAAKNQQAFVVSQSGGTWSTAIEVPGTADLNTGGDAWVTSMSCTSTGDCIAGGVYTDAAHHRQAFVVSETGGTWGSAVQVPGTARLNKGGNAETTAVSCATAGNCTAGGAYEDASVDRWAFVVSETGGKWGTAIRVPGTTALNKGGNAEITSVSCVTAGNCTVGGDYADASYLPQALVVSQTGGTWGTAIEVPGTAALNKGGSAEVLSVSCRSAGNCSAGGDYLDGSFHVQAFAVNETGGTWGTAIEVPGTAALNKGGIAEITSVSCPATGNCGAGGEYEDAADHFQAFVVSGT
jgi:hypothetical protein